MNGVPSSARPTAITASGNGKNPANAVFYLDQSDDAHREVYGERRHESSLSHELIAGAASFAGMKAWEDHQRSEGKPIGPYSGAVSYSSHYPSI